MPLNLPIQAVVDRSAPLQLFLVDTPVPAVHPVLILRNPIGGTYGPMPSDPAVSSSRVNPRLAVCQVLSAYAVPRCLRGGGYF
jgi:hypothetical protein